MADPIFIGIDTGTQGTKIIAFNRATGRTVASAFAGYPVSADDHGSREQSPQLWIDAIRACFRDIFATVNPADVYAIGVSGQQHGCVALDADGNVLRPAKLWCDTSTVDECREILDRAGGKASLLATTGSDLAVGFTASKVLHFQKHHPDLWQRLATIFLPHDYINFWLTDRRCMEAGDASGTGYFDIHKRAWSPELVRAVDPSGKLAAALPELIAADQPVGKIRSEIAAEFKLPASVLVSSGGGDNMMAAIGTGNVRPGIVTCSLGTSGTLFAFSDRPVTDPNGELAGFCSSSGGWLPLICTMNVTVVTEEIRQLLGLDLKTFDAHVAAAQPGAGGLRFLPYLNGERTPALPRARGTLAGISTTNLTPQNLCRAAMEGATLGLRYGLDILRHQNLIPREIRLVGGGAKSAIWRQLCADIFGCSVVCPVNKEAGALGAALQSIWCLDHAAGHTTPLGNYTDPFIQLDPVTRTSPDPAAARAYDAIYADYLSLNTAMAPWKS